MPGRFGISLRWIAVLGLGAAAVASAQVSPVLSCQANVNPIVVRGEGLTERMGDIVFLCEGGQPNQSITGNLSVFLSVTMTNRVDAGGNTDLTLTVDNGGGPVPVLALARYISPSNLSFSGVQFTLSSTGSATIRLSNLRGAAYQAGVNSTRQITASLSFNAGGLLAFSSNIFPVGTVLQSLYSSSSSSLICAAAGTPSIDNLTMTNALAVGASFSTVRVTEGFNSAFLPRSNINYQGADAGSRVLIQFSGVPAGVHLYSPDVVVGTDGYQPTSAGDYGIPAAGGTYFPGRGELLLIRVVGADAAGGGLNSYPVYAAPNTIASADTLSEIPVNADGTAQVVYEVMDSNPLATESATIPTFISVPPNAVTVFTPITQSVVLAATAPASNLSTAPGSDVPRFVPVLPPNDCAVVGDCAAPYFPKLAVSTNTVDIPVTTQDKLKTQYVQINNTGGGNFLWNATVTYLSGPAGKYQWLQPTPSGGINNGTMNLNFVPGTLQPGLYDALVTVDAGPTVGKQLIQVIMRLGYQAPTPILINAVNPANLVPGNLVPGSLALIQGDRLEGNTITVLFNNSPAQVVQAISPQSLVVQVPYDMAGQQTALITVNVDGTTGDGLLMPIVASAPGIYANSIVNGDNTRNGPNNGAITGTTVSLYATGLPSTGYYSGQIHDRILTSDNGLVYVGPAPLAIGIQLIQMTVPGDLPTMTTGVDVCGGLTVDTQVCSGSVDITLYAPPQSSKRTR